MGSFNLSVSAWKNGGDNDSIDLSGKALNAFLLQPEQTSGVGVKCVERALGQAFLGLGLGAVSSSSVALNMSLPLSQAQFPLQFPKMKSTVTIP